MSRKLPITIKSLERKFNTSDYEYKFDEGVKFSNIILLEHHDNKEFQRLLDDFSKIKNCQSLMLDKNLITTLKENCQKSINDAFVKIDKYLCNDYRDVRTDEYKQLLGDLVKELESEKFYSKEFEPLRNWLHLEKSKEQTEFQQFLKDEKKDVLEFVKKTNFVVSPNLQTIKIESYVFQDRIPVHIKLKFIIYLWEYFLREKYASSKLLIIETPDCHFDKEDAEKFCEIIENFVSVSRDSHQVVITSLLDLYTFSVITSSLLHSTLTPMTYNPLNFLVYKLFLAFF